jgi:hypothetical protein
MGSLEQFGSIGLFFNEPIETRSQSTMDDIEDVFLLSCRFISHSELPTSFSTKISLLHLE